MKKRILSIILSASLIVSLLPATAFALRGGGTEVEVATWPELQSAIDAAGTTPTTIILTQDVSRKENQPNLSVYGAGKDITIDLNGHVLNGFDYNYPAITRNVIKVDNGGTLTLIDSDPSAAHTGSFEALPAGGCITGGKVDGSGGAVFVPNGTFNMKGGTITGNTAANGSGGGGVYVAGTFNMEGGNVTGNTAVNGGGGGVYVVGTFNMEGGNVTGNTAVNGGGGGVYVIGTFNMEGGNVTGNTASINGGGVYVHGTFNMKGGTVTGNTASTYGGGVYVTPNTSSTLGGTAVITGNTVDASASNFFLLLGKTITLAAGDDAPAPGMAVGVTIGTASSAGNVTGNVTSAEDTAKYAQYFTSDNASYQAFGKDGKVYIGTVTGGNALNVNTGTAYTTIAEAITAAEPGDAIRLLADFTEDVAVEKSITLDLNGKALKGTGSSSVITVNTGAELTLTDSDPSAVHKFRVDDTTGLWTLDETGGEKTVSGGVITGGKGNYNGGGVDVAGVSLVMNGGNIVGNSAIFDGGGVNVIPAGSFIMNGGSITGNTSDIRGGGVSSRGNFTMNGGSIEYNRVLVNDFGHLGGGVFNSGSFTMTAGRICNNYSRGAGAIQNNGTAILNLLAAEGKTIEITGNKAGNYEGGIAGWGIEVHLSGKVIIKDNVCDNTYNGTVSYPVNLATNKPIIIDGALTGSEIYITHANISSDKHDAGVLTGGFTDKNPDAKLGDFFIYDGPDSFTMTLNSDGELEVKNVYAITNNAPESSKDSANGYLSIDKTSAVEGDTVTITAVPNEDCQLKADSLKVYPSNCAKCGEALTSAVCEKCGEENPSPDLSLDQDGTYTFTMPAYNVTVTAEFEPHVHNFTFEANNEKITASCIDGCIDGLDAAPLTLTLTSPASFVYDGNAKIFTYADGEASAWEAAGLTVPDITYEAKAGSSLTDGKALNAGSYTAKAVFENKYTAAFDFSIAKAAPYIATAPAPNEITYGNTLSDSTLFGGYAQLSSSNRTQIGGMFEWTSADTVPEVSDSEKTEYSVTFTPSSEYADNFTTATCMVKLTVNPADYTGVTMAASAKLKVATGSAIEINLPAIPEDASYGEVIKTVPGDPYTLSEIADGKITATSGGIASEEQMTFTVEVLPDGNHNGYTITVTLIPTLKEVVTVTAKAENFTYGESSTGYADLGVSDHDELLESLEKTYFKADGMTKTDADDGAGTEGGMPSNAGSYTVVISVPESNEDYTGSTAVSFTIAKKVLTITANDKDAYVGDEAPALGEDDFTAEGLVGSDALTVKPALAYESAPDMSKEGTASIKAGGADAGSNYEITYVDGTLTISGRPSPEEPEEADDEPETFNVPVSAGKEDVKAKATISGKTASIQSIKEKDLQKLTEGGSGMVVFDLTETGRSVTGVKLPAEAVQTIAEAAAGSESGIEGLRLELSSGILEFDAKALEAIAAASGHWKNIEIHFDEVGTARLNRAQKDAISEMDVLKGFEAYVTVNGSRVSDFGGGKAAVYIPYKVSEDDDPENYTVWYIAEDGSLEKQDSTYEDEFHRFEVSHFSDYILTFSEASGQYDNCSKDETCPLSSFTDVNVNAWYHDSVHYCLEKGLMEGMGEGIFAPAGTTSRAMIVTMLWRMEGEKYVNYAMSFSDVSEDMWYTEAIRWAASEGLVEGYDDGTFRPGKAITREELAAILYRLACKTGEGFTGASMFLMPFEDLSEISDWAHEAVRWCYMKGIVEGKDGGVFDPKDKATRAEAAAMIQRFCEAMEK